MSVCIFLAADGEMPIRPHANRDHFITFDTESGKPFDGDLDDEFALLPFPEGKGYSSLSHALELEWNYYTPGRAEELLTYIKCLLDRCDEVEVRKVWLMDSYEFEERPHILEAEVLFPELSIEDLREVTEAEVWGQDPERPTDYCLRIRKADSLPKKRI